MRFLQKERRSVAGRETTTQRILMTATDSLPNEHDLFHQILPIQSQPYPRIDLRLRHLSAAAGTAHMSMAVAVQYHRPRLTLAREDTAMLQMGILRSRTLRMKGNDRNPDPGNGPMIGISGDDAGRAARRNAGEIEIQRSTTLGEPNGAVKAWTRAKSQRNGAL
jgi:hypothetical protein